MDEEQLITSGRLELFVSGNLPPNEMEEIARAVASSTALRSQVEDIENTLNALAAKVAPILPLRVWNYIKQYISSTRGINSKKGRTNWPAITGWAAVGLCLIGLFSVFDHNKNLEEKITAVQTERDTLQTQKNKLEAEKEHVLELVSVYRSEHFTSVPLPGNQSVAPAAAARVLYNSAQQIAYVDAASLPPAPRGKVYQVWSLVLEPLTPTSMGLIDTNTLVVKDVYKFVNVSPAQGFGITLEPEGGSQTPTMSQLFTLGTIAP
ncbi:MAG: anti-sigma factor [Marinirhabdus sp.]